MKSHEIRGSGVRLEKLAMITNRSEDKLDVIAYSAPPGQSRWARLLGHPVLPQDLNLTHPRFCPHCVRERGFLEAHWDLALMVACPASLQARLSVLDFPITVRTLNLAQSWQQIYTDLANLIQV